MIKDEHPSNQLITKVQITSNHFFQLRIFPDMKGNTNIGAALKEKSKEAVEHFDKKENDSADFQAPFQTEFQNESWPWNFRFGCWRHLPPYTLILVNLSYLNHYPKFY